MPARARRSVFAFLVQGGSALGSVTFPVLASAPWVTNGSAQPHSCSLLESGVVNHRGVGGWELEETSDAGPAGAVETDPVSAVGAGVVAQVSGGFVAAGECEGALRGCCGIESCQVVGVITSFSPGGLQG